MRMQTRPMKKLSHHAAFACLPSPPFSPPCWLSRAFPCPPHPTSSTSWRTTWAGATRGATVRSTSRRRTSTGSRARGRGSRTSMPAASVCAPSRSVLMTGQHLGHTRVRGNAGMVGGVGQQRRVPLEPEDVTVAMLLKQAGYVTGHHRQMGPRRAGHDGHPEQEGLRRMVRLSQPAARAHLLHRLPVEEHGARHPGRQLEWTDDAVFARSLRGVHARLRAAAHARRLARPAVLPLSRVDIAAWEVRRPQPRILCGQGLAGGLQDPRRDGHAPGSRPGPSDGAAEGTRARGEDHRVLLL